MIAFHGVKCIYFFLCPLARVCIVYVVKEIASFPGAQSININIFLKFLERSGE